MGTVEVSIPLPADLFRDAERVRKAEQRRPSEFYGEAVRLYLATEGHRRADRRGGSEFRQALDVAAGIWRDHPDFRDAEDVREWRRHLWAQDQARLAKPRE